MRHKYRYQASKNNSLLTSSTWEENDSSMISFSLEEEPVTKRARVTAEIETGIQTMNLLSLPSTNDTTKNTAIQEEVKEEEEEENHIPELVKAQRALISKFILQRIYCERGRYEETSKSLIDSKIEKLIRGSLQKAMKEQQQQQNLDVLMSERDGDSDSTNAANTYKTCWEDGHNDDDDDTTLMDTS